MPVDSPQAVANPLRRNRDFRLFWVSQTLSSTGTRASTIAFPLLVLAATGSAARAGAVGFAQTLPFLFFFLPAGGFVDRFDRKRIMLISEVIRFSAIGSAGVALLTDNFHFGHILAVAFIEGAATVFFEVAEGAALPHLVSSEQLPTAMAQNQARQQGAELWGQPLGGFLFGVGRSIPFLFDALTYLASFVALTLIRPRFQQDRAPSDTSMMSDIRDGVRWLWNQPFLRALTGLSAMANFVISALVLTVIVKAQTLGASGTVVGLVLAGFGIGSMLGSTVAPAILRRIDGRQVAIASLAFWALAIAALIPASIPALVGVAFGAGGIAGPAFNIMVGKYRYGLTPDALQGRVMSTSRVVGWGAIPLGSMVAGFAIESLGEQRTLLFLALLMAAAAVLAAVLPGLRSDPLQSTV